MNERQAEEALFELRAIRKALYVLIVIVGFLTRIVLAIGWQLFRRPAADACAWWTSLVKWRVSERDPPKCHSMATKVGQLVGQLVGQHPIILIPKFYQ